MKIFSTFISLLLFSGTVHAYFKVPVSIIDSRIKLEPKLALASTFAYSDSIYAYGGLYSLYTYNVSNLFYKYNFDEIKHTFQLSLLNTTNAGPRCSECNPVFIPNTNKILILSNDKEAFLEGQERLLYFKPYVFDFDTLTWTDLSTTAVYDGGVRGQAAFEMREYHTTTLANDGMVYIIGGRLQTNYTEDSGFCPRSVIYYNISANSFHVLGNNAPRCLYSAISYVKAEANDEIHMLFGLWDFNITNTVLSENNLYGYVGPTADFTYSGTMYLSILHTSTGLWEYRALSGPHPYKRYGASAQYNPETKLLHVFGGISSDDDEVLSIYDDIQTLNTAVDNGTWLNKTSFSNSHRTEVATRFLASSVLFKNKYFMAFYGQDMEFISMISTKEIDVYLLPENSNAIITKYPLTLLNQDPEAGIVSKALDIQKKSVQYALVITAIIAVILIYILFLLVFKYFKLIDSVKEVLLSFLYQRRIGEPRSTELFRAAVKIVCFLIFCLFVIYAFDNVAHSTISTNSEFITLNNQTFPDVRFCFTNWNFSSDAVDNSIIDCQIKGESYTELADCAGYIKHLDSAIHTPILDETSYIQCFMFESDPELVSTTSRPSLIFSIDTTSLQVSSDSTVYIQVYDPQKNPNRYLFSNDATLPSGFTQDDLEYWSVMGDNTVEQIDGYSFMGLNDTMIVTFETKTYKHVDPNGAWNYIGGILPSYVTTNNLTVSYDQKAVYLDGGFVQLTPISFEKEIITEKRDNTIISALGSIGGILGLLATVRVFLFGSRPASPWGFVHTAFKPKHERLLSDTLDHGMLNSQHHLSNSDVTYIPLVEPVDDRFSHTFNKIHHQYHKDHTQKEVQMTIRSMEERLLRVEARNQMLELVLKSYYVDDQIFQSLKDTRDKSSSSSYNDTALFTVDQGNGGSASSSPTNEYYNDKVAALVEELHITHAFESKK